MKKNIQRAGLLLFLLFFCACEGATGPRVEKGEGADIQVLNGVLSNNMLNNLNFEIFTGDLTDCIINVYVRKSKEYTWFVPFWGFSGSKIYIYQIYQIGDQHSEIITPGYEYRIVIAE